MKLSAPYPYFGSKAAIADRIWEALGDPPNFVDPACGSASVLWLRPQPGKVETVNDAWAFIPNFLRAIQQAPEAVAEAADWPVSEVDMHARHRDLLARVDESFVERLMTDPRFFDVEVAGWWVWGQSIWIGSGWCVPRGAAMRKRPALGGHGGDVQRGYPKSGVGIFRGQLPSLTGSDGSGVGYGRGIHRGRLPHLIGPFNAHKDGSPGGVGYGRGINEGSRRDDLASYFRLLAERLRRVRITCGDWKRVLTPAVTISHGLTGVLLDPPYDEAMRTKNLYAVDSGEVAAKMREWAIENGEDPLYRIVLCGYDGEHKMPASWRCIPWKARGGYGNQDGENENARKERLWLSPHCLGGTMAAGPLFAQAASSPR